MTPSCVRAPPGLVAVQAAHDHWQRRVDDGPARVLRDGDYVELDKDQLEAKFLELVREG